MNRFLSYIFILIGILFFNAFDVMAFELSFSGFPYKLWEEVPPTSTGLNKIYVSRNVPSDIILNIRNVGNNEVTAKVYSNLGGGFSEPIPVSYENGEYSIKSLKSNMGYIIQCGGETYCFWLVDYSEYAIRLSSISKSADSGCDKTIINIDGSAPAIKYYTIDGRAQVLDRGIHIKYANLVWDDRLCEYVTKEIIKESESLEHNISIIPPLYCNSEIEIEGDRFLKYWGEELSKISKVVAFDGLAVQAMAERANEGDETSVQTELSGSAPIEVEFKSYFTDGVEHQEWQIAADESFSELKYRFNERDLKFTFTESGRFYVRFVGSNANGSCQAESDVFIINIDPSDLKIPNAFSPNGDGVNDVWKVSAKSLIKFKCSIFDKQGKELYYFDTPSGGWDGTYKGKKLGSGVYYYVLEAVGADGKVYKKGGDINVITYRKMSNNQNY